MMGERNFCRAIDKSLDRLGWVHVLVAHEPTGLVSTDRQNGKLERPVAFARTAEIPAVAIARVSNEIDASAGRLDHERRPERHVAVRQIARRPMLRSNKRHRTPATDLNPITPVVCFVRNCRIVISHDGVIAQRRNYTCTMCGCYSRQGAEV